MADRFKIEIQHSRSGGAVVLRLKDGDDQIAKRVIKVEGRIPFDDRMKKAREELAEIMRERLAEER